jgi:hypothetical protein
MEHETSDDLMSQGGKSETSTVKSGAVDSKPSQNPLSYRWPSLEEMADAHEVLLKAKVSRDSEVTLELEQY